MRSARSGAPLPVGEDHGEAGGALQGKARQRVSWQATYGVARLGMERSAEGWLAGTGTSSRGLARQVRAVAATKGSLLGGPFSHGVAMRETRTLTDKQIGENLAYWMVAFIDRFGRAERVTVTCELNGRVTKAVMIVRRDGVH